jgi:hypothetical protein
MTHSITKTTAIAALLLGATSLPVFAQNPTPKGPPVTMGDEGKLPATGTVSGKVPEMGATGAGTGESGSVSPDGRLRMGDEPGKLPATGTVSGATPKMNAPAETGK